MRLAADIEQLLEVRVAVVGNVDAGKRYDLRTRHKVGESSAIDTRFALVNAAMGWHPVRRSACLRGAAWTMAAVKRAPTCSAISTR